jgi:hypothetical protein
MDYTQNLHHFVSTFVWQLLLHTTISPAGKKIYTIAYK